jgi:hypothetical protein
MKDPAIARLVEEILPDYFDRRISEINKQAELQREIALLRLRGVQSKKDLMLEYGIRTGKVPLPGGPVFKPEEWYPAADTALSRGLFNPRRYIAAPALPNFGGRYDTLSGPARGSVSGSRMGLGIAMGGRAADWIAPVISGYDAGGRL